jgi:predicted DNA-binding transcriptional regulator YafY
MPKRNYINRYKLIIERLEKSPATFEQVSRHLDLHSDELGDDYSISIRTFQRDIKDIYEQFGYEIANERTGDKKYFIKTRPENADISNRLFDSFQMISIIQDSQKYNDIIYLESRRSKGLDNFHGLLHGINNKLEVSFLYQKYNGEPQSARKVHPLALKEAVGRWYLVCVDTKDNVLKTFGLDRISEVEFSKKPFKKLYDYNIKELFTGSFGVINDVSAEPQKVILSYNYMEGKYVEAYPIHISQKIISENKEKDEVIIELFLRITYDFKREILSHGNRVKVLSPKSLADEIRNISIKIASKYE